MTHIQAVVLDIDGTLIESNDAHARAWVEAMKEHGHDVPYEKVRPQIGMGGDKVLPETLGLQKESPEGKQISSRRKEIFKERYLPNLRPTPGAKALLQEMHNRGLKLVVATSAEPDETQALLDIIDAGDLIDRETTSQDAQRSKPSADVMHVTLQRLNLPHEQVLMLGDTAYDIEAAKKVGVGTIALRCGGWSDRDLAGALAIYNDPADLLAYYERSPLGQNAEEARPRITR